MMENIFSRILLSALLGDDDVDVHLVAISNGQGMYVRWGNIDDR